MKPFLLEQHFIYLQVVHWCTDSEQKKKGVRGGEDPFSIKEQWERDSEREIEIDQIFKILNNHHQFSQLMPVSPLKQVAKLVVN